MVNLRVCRGVTRWVILVGPYAIKVPKVGRSWRYFLQGFLCNYHERDTWQAAKATELDHLLCPILWMSYGGFILVMARAEPVNDLQGTDLHRKHFFGDEKPANYGRLNGNIVKLDYGEV